MLWGRVFKGGYGDGGVALYCRAGEVQSMGSFSSAVEGAAGSIIPACLESALPKELPPFPRLSGT